jgi:hypothetical protein
MGCFRSGAPIIVHGRPERLQRFQRDQFWVLRKCAESVRRRLKLIGKDKVPNFSGIFTSGWHLSGLWDVIFKLFQSLRILVAILFSFLPPLGHLA